MVAIIDFLKYYKEIESKFESIFGFPPFRKSPKSIKIIKIQTKRNEIFSALPVFPDFDSEWVFNTSEREPYICIATISHGCILSFFPDRTRNLPIIIILSAYILRNFLDILEKEKNLYLEYYDYNIYKWKSRANLILIDNWANYWTRLFPFDDDNIHFVKFIRLFNEFKNQIEAEPSVIIDKLFEYIFYIRNWDINIDFESELLYSEINRLFEKLKRPFSDEEFLKYIENERKYNKENYIERNTFGNKIPRWIFDNDQLLKQKKLLEDFNFVFINYVNEQRWGILNFRAFFSASNKLENDILLYILQESSIYPSIRKTIMGHSVYAYWTTTSIDALDDILKLFKTLKDLKIIDDMLLFKLHQISHEENRIQYERNNVIIKKLISYNLEISDQKIPYNMDIIDSVLYTLLGSSKRGLRTFSENMLINRVKESLNDLVIIYKSNYDKKENLEYIDEINQVLPLKVIMKMEGSKNNLKTIDVFNYIGYYGFVLYIKSLSEILKILILHINIDDISFDSISRINDILSIKKLKEKHFRLYTQLFKPIRLLDIVIKTFSDFHAFEEFILILFKKNGKNIKYLQNLVDITKKISDFHEVNTKYQHISNSYIKVKKKIDKLRLLDDEELYKIIEYKIKELNDKNYIYPDSFKGRPMGSSTKTYQFVFYYTKQNLENLKILTQYLYRSYISELTLLNNKNITIGDLDKFILLTTYIDDSIQEMVMRELLYQIFGNALYTELTAYGKIWMQYPPPIFFYDYNESKYGGIMDIKKAINFLLENKFNSTIKHFKFPEISEIPINSSMKPENTRKIDIEKIYKKYLTENYRNQKKRENLSLNLGKIMRLSFNFNKDLKDNIDSKNINSFFKNSLIGTTIGRIDIEPNYGSFGFEKYIVLISIKENKFKHLGINFDTRRFLNIPYLKKIIQTPSFGEVNNFIFEYIFPAGNPPINIFNYLLRRQIITQFKIHRVINRKLSMSGDYLIENKDIWHNRYYYFDLLVKKIIFDKRFKFNSEFIEYDYLKKDYTIIKPNSEAYKLFELFFNKDWWNSRNFKYYKDNLVNLTKFSDILYFSGSINTKVLALNSSIVVSFGKLEPDQKQSILNILSTLPYSIIYETEDTSLKKEGIKKGLFCKISLGKSDINQFSEILEGVADLLEINDFYFSAVVSDIPKSMFLNLSGANLKKFKDISQFSKLFIWDNNRKIWDNYPFFTQKGPIPEKERFLQLDYE